MSENTLLTDADLVAGHLAGDRSAFAAIYDRYGNALYDVAAAMLRNRHDAADVTQDTFVVAAERMAQLRDPSRLKPWLLAILRNEVYRRTGRRARQVPTDFTLVGADVALPPTYADEASAAEYEELANLVRDAAAGLEPRDQLVLELAVRQGLEGDDLASALGVSAQQSYSLVHRMRQRTERSLGAFCVARRGRRDCPDLDQILAGWDGQFSVLVRKRVARHIDDCAVCERNRKKFVPLMLFGSAPAFAAPADLRDRVLGAVDAGSYGLTSTAAASQPYGFTAPGGFPATLRYSRRVVLGWLLGAAALMLFIGGGVFVAAGNRDDPPQLAISVGGPTTTPATTTTTAPTTTTTIPATTTTSVAPIVVTPTAPASSAPATTAPAPTTTVAPLKTTTTTALAATTTTTTPAPGATTTAPTTTTAAPTTTSAPTTTAALTTTVPPAPPGALALSAGQLDFGTTATSLSVQLVNEGTGPAAWSASVAPAFAGGTPFDVSPATGNLAPGAQQTITVTMSRAGLAAGSSHTAAIRFTTAGSTASLTARGAIAGDSTPPTLAIQQVSYQCNFLNNTVTLVVNVATSDPSTPITLAGTARGPRNLNVPIGWNGTTGTALIEPGAWAITVTATDAVGNTSAPATSSVNVACIG